MTTPAGGFGRDSVIAAIEAVKAGKLVVVTDDESRENEGDLIMAAEFATPETIGFMVRYTSGVICVSVRLRDRTQPSLLTDSRSKTALLSSWDPLASEIATAPPFAGGGRAAAGARCKVQGKKELPRQSEHGNRKH